MASTYTNLGIELQATGENAGTWGTKTNTNLEIIEQILGGFTQQSIAGGAQTTALTISDGSTGAVAAHRMIEFTGTITGNQIVTIPLDVQTFYILRNSTTGSFTVQFKYASGSGSTFTFSATNKGDKIVFASANDGTNPDIVAINTGISSVAEDPTPQLGGDLDANANNILIDSGNSINDENDLEQIKFSTTASAINEFTVKNAAAGNAPDLQATGDDTNIDLNLTPKGVGRATFNGQGKIQSVAEKATVDAGAGLSGTFNFDVLTQAVRLHTGNNTGNWTLNIRGDGSNTLNSIMDTGESITIALISTNGGTPYYNSAVQIDSSSVTPVWQGGSAPTEGNASSKDTYTYTIIKTADATFTVLASQTQFA